MLLPKLDKLVSLFFETGKLLRSHTKTASKLDPFSFLQIITLHYIAEKGRPPMKDIASHLSITPPSATAVIASLANAGHIVRATDQGDRRMVRLTITIKGRRILTAHMKRTTEKMKGIFSQLSNKDFDDFIRILEKLSRIYKQKPIYK